MATGTSGGGIWSPTSMYSRPDSPTDARLQSCSPILSWDEDKISEWLKQQNLGKHVLAMKEQHISSGAELLQLTEDHFKEMGITPIGERLALVNAIDRLRLEAGYFPSAKFCDSDFLLEM